jgi:hypothetical protein
VVAHHSENSTGRAWNTTAATFQILYLNASSTPIGLRASVDWDQIDYKDYSDGRTEVSFLFEGDPPPEGVVKLQPRQLVQGGSAPTSPLDELEYVWALTYSA